VYEVAPEAVKFEAVPEHIVEAEAFATTVGLGFTVTFAVAVQPFKLPVTVYKVELIGEATGLAIAALLKPILGVHE
jgi:hypothetical protein